MGKFAVIGKKNDFVEGQGKVIEVSGEVIAVFRKGMDFFAFQNECLHAGGPLGDGTLDDGFVTCPWHAWRYNIITGENDFDQSLKLKTYRTKIEGENVLIEV